MGLTPQDLKTLRATFRYGDHEFRQDYVYITEEAICERLEDVDPSWSFDIVEMTTRDNQAIVTMRLTVKGVTRVGVGMQTVQTAGEAEKGAATDALKRCARLFGVGRYLLGAPEKSKFANWLAQKQKELGVGGIDAQTGEVVAQKPAPPVETVTILEPERPKNPALAGKWAVSHDDILTMYCATCGAELNDDWNCLNHCKVVLTDEQQAKIMSFTVKSASSPDKLPEPADLADVFSRTVDEIAESVGATVTPLFFETQGVHVGKRQDGGKTLTFTSKDGTLATAFSRDVIKGVVPDDVYERLNKVAQHSLPTPVRVYWTENESGYKNVTRVEKVA